MKTSDWIIQEIGLAKGRAMGMILLLEAGVRKPGGLQGDLEYIPFDRSRPSECFTKILEMIEALRPKLAAAESISPPATSGAAMPSSPIKDEAADRDPKPTWTLEDYKSALIGAVIDGDQEHEKRLFESFAKSTAGSDKSQQAALEAFGLHLKTMLGKGADISRLSNLAQEQPQNADIWKYLAKCHEHYDQYEKAFQAYLKALSLASNDGERASVMADAAIALAKNGDKGAEVWLREQASKLTDSSPTVTRDLLWGLAALIKEDEEPDRWITYTEARMALRPDDHDLRFSLAYRYSQVGNHALALYHYLLIPSETRSAIVWNNIGAAYQSLGLNARSVAAYRTSEDLGGTRAASNLAHTLIESGFLKEAEEIC